MYDLRTPAGRDQVVVNQWPLLAAFAYVAFLHYGRGMVRIRMVEGEQWGIIYVSPTPDASPEVKQAVADYDPEREVVFWFDLGDVIFWERRRPPQDAPSPTEVFYMLYSTEGKTLH